jgi:hypothetical protein
MQKADGRVESDALRRAAAIVDEQRVKKRKERVDRIERWAARTPAKDDVGVRDADQVVEHTEIDSAGLALRTAQNFGSVLGEADALQDHAQAEDSGLDRLAPVGGEFVPMIAQGPLQNRALIGDLARDDAADDVVRPVGNPILLSPQENVAVDRSFDACLKASSPIEQDVRNTGPCAGLDQGRRHKNRAEDNNGG